MSRSTTPFVPAPQADRTGQQVTDALTVARLEADAESIAAALGPSDVVVDAGSGTGEFTVRRAGMVPQGRVIGVEPGPSILSAARRRAAANLVFRRGAQTGWLVPRRVGRGRQTSREWQTCSATSRPGSACRRRR